MTAADVYDALIATIEALDPVGGQQTASDRFRATEQLNTSSGSRAFDVIPLEGPAPAGETAQGIGTWGASPAAGADSMVVVFVIAILYHRTERRRAMQDADAVRNALIAIPGSALGQVTYSGQIHSVDVRAVSWRGPRDPTADGQIMAIVPEWQVVVRYDGRAA